MTPVNWIENRTCGEIQVGDSATRIRTLKPQDIQLFAIVTGDVNPTDVDPEYAMSSMFREVIAKIRATSYASSLWTGTGISVYRMAPARESAYANKRRF